eukprot:518495-Pelagomonas_calceolata.AAC.5
MAHPGCSIGTLHQRWKTPPQKGGQESDLVSSNVHQFLVNMMIYVAIFSGESVYIKNIVSKKWSEKTQWFARMELWAVLDDLGPEEHPRHETRHNFLTCQVLISFPAHATCNGDNAGKHALRFHGLQHRCFYCPVLCCALHQSKHQSRPCLCMFRTRGAAVDHFCVLCRAFRACVNHATACSYLTLEVVLYKTCLSPCPLKTRVVLQHVPLFGALCARRAWVVPACTKCGLAQTATV